MKRALLVTVLAAVAATGELQPQGYPPSQRGSVMQSVALTQFTVTYGRPVARGRELWGALVPWDSIWHPGADSATVLTVDHDVLLEDKPLKAGEYSLWLIPRKAGNWTVIFSRAARVFHKPYPGQASDVLRLDVAPVTASYMESFAIYFPKVLRDEAVLQLHWGTLAAPIRVKAPFKPDD